MSDARRRSPAANPDGSGGKKPKLWNELRHNGPRFPDPYKKIKIENGGPPPFRYDDENIDLSIKAEEVAVFYAKYLMRKNRNKRQEKKLNENFFNDWKTYMTKDESNRITDLSKCDFSGIIEYLKGESKRKADEKKEKSVKERQQEREEERMKVQKFKRVIVDGREEELSNYMVEPPGLFMGRGANNRIGKVKRRIEAEDVIINCSAGSDPKAPDGHEWQDVVHEQTSMWLAKWDDPITTHPKYIQLDPGSKLKSDNDKLKYDKATELKRKIAHIRRKYTTQLKSKDLQERQHATALYIIDEFAIRAGNEKSKEEVDTVGCCSLRKEHIYLRGGNKIEFNFNGKDSIRYKNQAKVIKEVYKNLEEFRNAAKRGEDIFSEISTETLNRYLNKLMPGLTAKVFRTFKATECFEENIKEFKKELRRDADIKEKKIVFDRANLEVAKLLNHRTLVKNDGRKKGIDKLDKKVRKMQADLKQFKGGNKDRKVSLQKNLRTSEAELALKRNMEDYALNTSKANYINPKVVLNWCTKLKVEREKIYTKGQLKKFKWAIALVGGNEGGEVEVEGNQDGEAEAEGNEQEAAQAQEDEDMEVQAEEGENKEAQSDGEGGGVDKAQGDRDGDDDDDFVYL